MRGRAAWPPAPSDLVYPSVRFDHSAAFGVAA
jgi:hypothetical protein